ncbi:LAME_0F03444g1_1 [Lachancea meyersii CBS 8951]|uniref:LAME_0F03444g1_1 n=1 Tax=Lachancea meyersii CBS 8951 TaxID=1266667 RepID=A0A1G4JR87_9SACH|nr:LAME_0F03444g1_1 [Lachancea meyersii CBS 8951]
MEYIKIAKHVLSQVDDVVMHKKGVSANGTLHLTTHHLIFASALFAREFWFAYPTIGSVFKNRGSTLISKYKNHSDCEDPLYEDKDMWQFWNIKIIGKDYTVFSLDFEDERLAQDVYDSMLKLTVLHEATQLYAFIYPSNRAEQRFNSWEIYDPVKEFQRQGISFGKNCPWRLSSINQDYTFCKTYPKVLVIPSTISDTLLTHSMKYRSQSRIPALTYYHRRTRASITRCAQPLPGLIQQRSVQDEKLVSEIFNCSLMADRSHSRAVKNIIVDARPTKNAMAQTALGGGTENMDNYNFGGTVSRMFLGIDNIHIMRDMLNNVVDNFLVDSDLNLPIDVHALNEGKSAHWLKYVRMLLSSTDTLAKSMLFNESNILVHCSDGWDRTTQVCSLVQICLDPHFRTFEGFMILIEKDWLSFGHRFAERTGHLSSESSFHDNSARMSISGAATNMTQGIDLNASLFGFSNSASNNNNNKNNNNNSIYDRTEIANGELADLNFASQLHSTDIVSKVSKKLTTKKSSKFTSPVFQQFLDCVYQLHRQNPSKFEFNERFLRRLVYHLYSCQYGTFLFDSEQERASQDAQHKTRSVWDYFRSRKAEFTNADYKTTDIDDDDWILPDLKNIAWWWQLFGKRNEEMNVATTSSAERPCSAEENKRAGLKFPSLNLDIFGRR